MHRELSIQVNLAESRQELDVFVQIGLMPLVKVGSASILDGHTVETLMQPVKEAAGKNSTNSKNSRRSYTIKKKRMIEVSTQNLFSEKDENLKSSLGELYIKSATQLLYSQDGKCDLWGKPLEPILVTTPFIRRDKNLKTIDVLYPRDVNSINPVFAYKKFRPSESAFAWLFWAEQHFLAFSHPRFSKIDPKQITIR